MANQHFGKFADVWKHMVVDEVLVHTNPARYAETHAGSAAYPMFDDAERRFGVLGFLDGLGVASGLAGSAFHQVVAGFVNGQPSLYPGSALQSMALLGDECTYLLCDVDPVSADDLRMWGSRLSLSGCEVVHGDGMAAVREWIIDPSVSVVHIDPFDPFAHHDGGRSAIEVAAEAADAGHTLVFWYGISNPDERAWAFEEIRSRTNSFLWCGEFMVTSRIGTPTAHGNLGEATTPGTGCGVVLANVSPTLLSRCQDLAYALAEHYEGRKLPNGQSCHLDLAIAATP